MTCKCHSEWGNKGKREQKWFIATTVCVIAIGIAGGIVITTTDPAPRDTGNAVLYPEQSEDRIPGDGRFMALPLAPHCGHLYNHPGKHKLWASCMGVGYDDSKIDRALYEDRGDVCPDCTKIPTNYRIHEWRAHCKAAGRDKKERAYR